MPVTLISNPDGSFREVNAELEDKKWVDLETTGGWIAWTQNSTDALSPALALVAGSNSAPEPDHQWASPRLRYGTGPPENDFEAVEFDPFVNWRRARPCFSAFIW